MNITIIVQGTKTEFDQFYPLLLTQTSTIHECICVCDEPLADYSQSPFPIYRVPRKQGILQALKMVTGKFIVFAHASDSISAQRVYHFKQRFIQDPYLQLVFHNAEINDQQNQIQHKDYLAIAGFYETYDAQKPILTIIKRGRSFLQYSQLGISQKFAQKIISFYQDYPTYATPMSFHEFLLVFASVHCPPKEVFEIPYVLSTLASMPTQSFDQIVLFLEESISLCVLLKADSTHVELLRRAKAFFMTRQDKPSTLDVLTQWFNYGTFDPLNYRAFWRDLWS